MLFLPIESSQTLEMVQSGMNRLWGESTQSTILVVCVGRGGNKYERDEDKLRLMCSTFALQDLISQHRKEGCSVMTGVGVFAITADDAMF